MAERAVVEALGALGDGIVRLGETRLHVPLALPGEVIDIERVGGLARLLALREAAPNRIAPICAHFASCGGCTAQHMDAALYAEWKRGLLVKALARAGVEATVGPLVDAHGEGRRRVTLHARMREGAVRVGFMAPRSHSLVAIERCPVCVSDLAGATGIATALAEALGDGKPLDIQLTATATGLDVDIRGHGPARATQRAVLSERAEALDLARLSLHGDVVVERRAPLVAMGRALVAPPPGAFLQATRAGEEVLARHIVAAVAGSRRIADLYAGCGPFALRLAEGAEIRALDSDGKALAALDRAAGATPGLRRIATETRDLMRRPLLAAELAGFDAVVLDPPRAGAAAQAAELARTAVAVVVAVSCDPTSFARDAATLIQAGYRLERVSPIDQFRFSPHLEIVGVLRHPGPRKRIRTGPRSRSPSPA